MKRIFLIMLTLLFAVGVSIRAQETTGGVEGTVKDQAGALIAGATVELTGSALIGAKVLKTNSSGYYEFVNLSPGFYTITISSPNFATYKRDNIRLEVGHLPTIDAILHVGLETTVVEVSATSPIIDITQSKVQTNVTKDVIDYTPRGRDYTTAIAMAPGARLEPLQGGYSIDGGASSENGYLIEGQETSNLVTGQPGTKAPFEFIQEVQIKSSGFEAENGGALGGVVNAVQQRGGNTWHGSVFMYYEANPMDANPATTERYNPQTSYPTTRGDRSIQYYTPIKDHFRYVQPGFTAGGYLIKDRLWSFLSFAPQYNATKRNVVFAAPYGLRNLEQDSQTYFSLARLDYKISNKYRVYGSWQYGFNRIQGTSFPTADSIEGLFNASSTTSPDNFQHGVGTVSPNMLITSALDSTLSSSLVASTKFGYTYQNTHDIGKPTGLRYVFNNSSLPTAADTGNAANLSGIKDNTSGIGLAGYLASGGLDTIAAAYPSASQTAGFSNLSDNTQTSANVNARTTFSQDISWFKKGFFGAHNLKGGYQFNRYKDIINSSPNVANTILYYGSQYTPLSSNLPNCLKIEAANLQTYGTSDNANFTTDKVTGKLITTPDTAVNNLGCMGRYGYAEIRDIGTIGQATSNTHGIFVQDGWTIGKGVTLNVGFRIDKETLPSYDAYPSGINFGWGSKIAPRLGGAWDVLRNGKLKVFGSYGKYFDIMKLNLAIDSFGGSYWHSCFYAMDTANFNTINLVKNAQGHTCGGTGDATFASGSTPAGLRFIENQDYRIPANDPTKGASVDPNLKPYQEHESVFGADYQISRNWAFEGRWTRRRLDTAIEDAGTVTPAGETFYIVNPGKGLDLGGPSTPCPSCKFNPTAQRAYDGAEFKFTRTGSKHWFGQFDYTYSRLRGNYSGLTDSDISDGGGARNSANDSRAFDEPFFQFTSHGTVANGLLATDRPHTFKAYGYYQMSYLKRHKTNVGLFQQLYSGTPLSTYMDVQSTSTYTVFVEGRGKWVPITADANGTMTFGTPTLRRTPIFAQTDGTFVQEYKVSPAHEGWVLGFEGNVTNVLNTKHATQFGSRINTEGKTNSALHVPNGTTPTGLNYGVLEGGYDYQNLSNNPIAGASAVSLYSAYGLPQAYQAGRSIRLKMRFTF